MDIVQWDGEKETLEGCLTEYTVRYINDERERKYKSCKFLPTSSIGQLVYETKMPWVDEDSKTYHEFVTLNSGLGNRHPRPGMDQTKECILCENDGVVNRIDEQHLLFDCIPMEQAREATGIKQFMSQWENRGLNADKLYNLYWTDRNINWSDLRKRIRDAQHMKHIFLEATKSVLGTRI